MADLLIVVGDHEDSAAYDSYDVLKRRLRCKVENQLHALMVILDNYKNNSR